MTDSGAINFDGIEWDLEMTVDRLITWKNVIGGAPRAIPMWNSGGAEHDIAHAKFTMWGPSSVGALMEPYMPPRGGTGHTFSMYLPSQIPGWAQWDGSRWVISTATNLSPIESMGRKGPLADLFGYRFDLSWTSGAGGTAINERGSVVPTSTAVPAVVARRFAAHQIQDPSRSAQPLPILSPTYAGVKHAARLDATIALDHLTPAEADSVVMWFRAIRAQTFTIATAKTFGPTDAGGSTCVVTDMKLHRGSGWWYDIELSLTKV